MKLSELDNCQEDVRLVYGVEVDTDLLYPPAGLHQIGLLYQGAPDMPAENFIDSVIACTLANIDTIGEIEITTDIDPFAILSIAGNAGFSVAILPPEQPEALEKWCERCALFAKAYLTTPNFKGDLYPVSGYFGHLVAHAVTGISQTVPTDPYVRQRFSDAIPAEWSDKAKAAMKDAWAEQLGGDAQLTAFLKEITNRAVHETMNLLDRLTDEETS